MNKLLLLFLLLPTLSCRLTGGKGAIRFVNNSGQRIDSLVINANGHTVAFYNILPGKTVVKQIASGSIKGGHHVEMVPHIYYKGQVIKGAYYYNDLSGFYGTYTINVDTLMNVKWKWKTDY